MPEASKSTANPFQIDAEKAQKILNADLANLVRKVSDGKPLTKWERERVEQLAGPHGDGSLPVSLPTYATSQLQLAKILGINRQRLNYRAHQPGNPGRRPNGTYHVATWRKWLTSIGVVLGDATPGDDGLDQTNLKARQILLQNRKLEYELAILRKEYVAAKDVEAWGGELGAAIRKVVTQLRKLAPTLAGLSVAEIEARLRESEYEIMAQLHSIGDHVATMKTEVIQNKEQSNV